MNPQNTPQASQPLPNAPTPPSAQIPGASDHAKSIQNAGRSTMTMGVLLLVISLISLFGVSSLAEDRQMINWIFLPIVAIVSVLWIVCGQKLKKATDTQAVLVQLKLAMFSAFLIAAITLIVMIISPGGGGLAGLLSLALAIYLLVIKLKFK